MSESAWYHHFWAWVLFGLPATVVVAALATVWIAVDGADSLVVDDYYKEGLAINRRFDRQAEASRLNMSADLQLANGIVKITLRGDINPAALSLLLSHPMDAKLDQNLRVPKIKGNIYQVPVQLGPHPRWHWRIKPLADTAQDWQLEGELLR